MKATAWVTSIRINSTTASTSVSQAVGLPPGVRGDDEGAALTFSKFSGTVMIGKERFKFGASSNDAVYEQIGTMILDGSLSPGSRIVESGPGRASRCEPHSCARSPPEALAGRICHGFETGPKCVDGDLPAHGKGGVVAWLGVEDKSSIPRAVIRPLGSFRASRVGSFC